MNIESRIVFVLSFLLFLSVNLLSQINNKATALTSGIWEEPTVTVCWENPDQSNLEGRNWTREAVENTWQRESGLNFVGWGTCTTRSMGIRILIDDDGLHTKGLGRHLDGIRNGMVLNFTFQNWNFGCQNSLEFCIKSIAIHEFGHAIGLAHEQNRADAPDWCQDQQQGTTGDWNITEFDINSIMNYCNPN